MCDWKKKRVVSAIHYLYIDTFTECRMFASLTWLLQAHVPKFALLNQHLRLQYGNNLNVYFRKDELALRQPVIIAAWRSTGTHCYRESEMWHVGG